MTTRVSGPTAVVARAVTGRPRAPEARFTRAFTIGSALEADFQLLDPGVASIHAEVIADGILWWIRDFSGAAGTYVEGHPVTMVPLREPVEIELGKGGPRLRLEVLKGERATAMATATAAQSAPGAQTSSAPARPATAAAKTAAAKPAPARTADARTAAGKPAPAKAAPERPAAAEPSHGGFTSETQILRRFLGNQGGTPAGRETMMFRKAFERVKKRSTLPYQILAAVVLVALVVAGAVILKQQRKLVALRDRAEKLFYATRTVDVEIAQLEELVLARSDRKDLSALLDRKAHFSQMETEYDAFVKELGVYAKLPEEEQIILRTARAFGECEVNVPPEFVTEVKKYIQRWRSSERLARALQRSRERNYGPSIQRVLVETGLPRQFVYLPLVESGYDDRAVGPPTRYGHAKGMWQFISSTADHYGLKVGPLFQEPSYDPKDDRFDWQKETTAAVRYIRELSASDAQASGLLVMACYNWGEGNVRALIQKLPANPSDRNFWRLLRHEKVPQETYDYVLSIFSAAVICENPKLFGFKDLTCPAMQPLAEATPARAGG